LSFCPAAFSLGSPTVRTQRRRADILRYVALVDWDNFDIEPLTRELRCGVGGPDGEKMIWAFERTLEIARIDPDLLSYVLAAAACLLAHQAGESPGMVLAAFARRSVPDREWRERYAGLFPA
jgi:hypothetical protein